MDEIFHLKGMAWGNYEGEELIGSVCVTNARLGDFCI